MMFQTMNDVGPRWCISYSVPNPGMNEPEGQIMIHYSCDRCSKPIDPQEDVRYVVKIEVEAVMEPMDGFVDDEERDYLMEISEIIERGEDSVNPLIGDDVYSRKRFDLCSDCHRQFSKAPIGENRNKQFNFSDN